MLMNADSMFQQYIYGKVVSIKSIDTSHCETDKRFTYIINTDLNEEIVIKFSNNSFTTPERVKGWRQLINLYNDLGIYAPKILLDKNNHIYNEYVENGEKYIVYAEEKKIYKTADEFGIACNDDAIYFEDMVEATVRVAKYSTQLPPWKSAWCLYDKHCIDDQTDETVYWQQEFYNLVLNEMPIYEERAKRIYHRFLDAYKSFEAQYRALPQAFFQGDIGGLNTMLDENQKFVGVLDFNLAGAETNLNYFFQQFCRVAIREDDLLSLNDKVLRLNKDMEMRKRLDIVKKYYEFNSTEIEAFPMYYKIVYPLQCDNCQRFMSVIHEKNIHKLELILDWIEYQQTRNDIFL